MKGRIMKEFEINRGIGSSVEFKGLKAQYLFYFAGGLLGLLILVMILYMCGANPYLCIGVGLLLGGNVVYGTFYLNKKYGEHGLMKLTAKRRHPKYIIVRKSVSELIKQGNSKAGRDEK